MNLSTNPTLQQQTGKMCMPTCIAMALDIPATQVIEEMEALGIDLSDGTYDRDIAFYLVQKGIAVERFLNHGLGMPDGLYITTVPSLNVHGTHGVLIFVKGNTPIVLDPNNGKSDKNHYSLDSFYDIPGIYFERLDDFADLNQADKEAESPAETDDDCEEHF